MSEASLNKLRGITWGELCCSTSSESKSASLIARACDLDVTLAVMNVRIKKVGFGNAIKFRVPSAIANELRQRLFSKPEDRYIRRLYLAARTCRDITFDECDGFRQGRTIANKCGVIAGMICIVIGLCSGITTKKVPYYFMGMIRWGETKELSSWYAWPFLVSLGVAFVPWLVARVIIAELMKESYGKNGPKLPR